MRDGVRVVRPVGAIVGGASPICREALAPKPLVAPYNDKVCWPSAKPDGRYTVVVTTPFESACTLFRTCGVDWITKATHSLAVKPPNETGMGSPAFTEESVMGRTF